MNSEPLTATCGVLVSPEQPCRLAAVPDAIVVEHFHEHGVVVFRGFAPEVAEFDAFARRFSVELMPGVGRSTFPDHALVHLVNETLDALEPHTDNGTRPEEHRPEITWMLCERPADADGETTVFDGVAIWRRLSPETRARLHAQRLMFSTRYAQAAWRAMRFATLADFRKFVESVGGTMRPAGDDGSVDIDVRSWAWRRTARHGDAFVASIALAGAKGFEHMRVRFEDDSEIPDAMRAEINAAIAAVCEPIRWCAGDVAMLDNTRILHGRRAYRDTRRRLYLLQTRKARV